MKIDKRIVEMGFENKGFEAGVKQSQSSLQDLDRLLSQAGKGTSFSPLGSVVEGVGGKFSLLGTMATGALLKIGSQAVVAGQQLINSLGMEQVNKGFQEYELKIGSIRTMLAGGRDKNGLPVTLEMVNEQLEALNKYSDQTIYSFSDMTRNIGKFTNAGVDLETAVQAIKGISNAAALSGSNSEEASRAMYNFSQALSAGYVKLIDWKSIENANMATVDFKTELLKTAAALGTVKENADGTYQVLTDGGWGLPLSPTKNFNDSLQKQWMTSDVLTQTLTRYTDTTTELGKKATEAATKVRTFTQLMDTTKEALGSGWAMTAENIFGDYDEATKLWSGVSDVLGDIILKSSDARNSMLKDWKELGGRRYVIEGITTAWENFNSIADSVKLAFRDVFPPVTATTLRNLSVEFKLFMKALTPTADTLSKTKIIFEGLFSALSLGWQLVESVFKGLFDGIKRVVDLIPPGENGGILGFLSKIAIFFIQLKDSAEKADTFAKIATEISDGLFNIATSIQKFYKMVSEAKITKDILTSAGKAADKFKEIFASLVTAIKGSTFISGILEKLNESLAKLFSPDAIGGKDSGLDKYTTKMKSFKETITGILEPIKDFISGIYNSIKDNLRKDWKFDSFEDFLSILKTLVASGIGISISKFIGSLTGISKSTAGAIDSFANFGNHFNSILTGFQGVLKSYQDNLQAQKLMTIAGAIALLVGSLAVLTLLDEKKMLIGIGVITALFIDLSGGMLALSKAGGLTGVSLNMLAMAGAIMLISSSLLMLQKVNPNTIFALSIIIGELVLANVIMSKIKSVPLGAANMLTLMAVAVDAIAIAVLILGKMNPEELTNGIKGVSILMAEMVLFSVVMGKFGKNPAGVLAAGLAMGAISLAILQLAGVVAVLGQIDPEKMATGLGGIAGIMLIMAVGMNALANPKVLIGAAAMIVLAAAITMFVPAIATLGSLPLKTVGTGLLAIAGIFAVLGLAGLVLGPVLPVILGVAAALALMGVAMLAAGTGILLFGTGLAFVATSGAAAISILILGLTGIISLLPLFAEKLGQAFVAFIETVGNSAEAIKESVGQIIDAFLNLIGEQIPKVIDTILLFIETLLTSLAEKVPSFIESGMDIILGFLEGVEKNLQPIIETVLQMLIDVLNGIATKLPDLIESGANIIIAFLEGIGREVPRVVDAAFQMIIDFINGLADSIRKNTKDILEAAENLATAFTDGIKDYLNVEEGETIAGNIIKGLINGIVNGAENVVQNAKDLAADIINGINNVFGNESPSKVMAQAGEYLDLGLIEGLKNRSQNVINAAKDLGESSIDALRSTMKKISDAVDGEINSSPVITPVLDLNKVRSGATNLSSLLSTGQSYNLAALKLGDDKLIEKNNQNGSNSSKETTQIIKNEFNLNGVTIRSEGDIDKLAEQLYNKQENAMRSRGIKPAYVY